MGLNYVLPVEWLCSCSSHLQSSDAKICTWSQQKKEGWAQLRVPTQLKLKRSAWPKREVTVSYQHPVLCTWAPDEAGSALSRDLHQGGNQQRTRGLLEIWRQNFELQCVWLPWFRSHSQTSGLQCATGHGHHKETACGMRNNEKAAGWKLANAGGCCNFSSSLGWWWWTQGFGQALPKSSPKKKCLWLFWSEQTESTILKSAQ